jgi:hypothetical protein
MDVLTIMNIEILNDDLNILCYEGDFLKYFEDEKIVCHNFMVKINSKNNNLKYLINNYENYLMNIIHVDKRIIFYDYSKGDEIILEYNELNEINNRHEEIINRKIKYLIENYENENKAVNVIVKRLSGIENFVRNELEKVKKRIEFYKKVNINKRMLYKNIGKYEILNTLLNKIEKEK